MPLSPVGGGPVVPVRFWAGSGSLVVSGATSFHLFDTDPDFVSAAPQLAQWVCSTLGYPIVSIELEDTNIYSNFEKSTMAFAAIVNEFNMRENMLSYQGMSTGSSFSQTLIRSTPVPYIVKLSADYGTEAMTGGTVDVKRGFVFMHAGQQEYDLHSLWAAVSESGNRIEIRRVFHERVPAMQRFFDPFAGTGTDMSALLGGFGWTGFAVASNFLIMPTYETILRAQAIELNDQIRRSNYSFEIRNNKLRLYPVPEQEVHGERIWFEYMVENEKFGNSTTIGSGSLGKLETGVVSDYSNVPFAYVPYSDINDVGRDWIFRYTLALCKITLGYIRNKYDTIPIPNAEVRLDGDKLRQEGAQEIERLEEYLRETLEQTGKSAQMTKQAENEIHVQEILSKVPMYIYIF